MDFLSFYRYLFLIICTCISVYYVLLCKNKMRDAVKLVASFGFCLCCDYRFWGFSLAQILLFFAFVFGFGSTRIYRAYTGEGGKLRTLIFIYTVYMSFVTIIGYLIGGDYRVLGTAIQNELRPLMQISQLIVLMFLVAYSTTLDKNSSVEILELINRAFVIVALMAVFQWAVYLFFKVDIFPIARDSLSGKVAVSAKTAHGFIRATSFVGEPKHLAKFMCIGISFELFCKNHKERSKINIPRLSLYTIVCLMTASATGAIIACAAYGLYFAMKAKRKGLLLAGLLIVFVAAVFTFRLPFVYQKIALNVSSGDIPGLENCDTAVVKWLLAKPYYSIFGVGMANTVCFAHEYVPSGTPWIANYVFTLRRGVILYLAEGGIVGLSLILMVFYRFFKRTPSNNMYRYELIFLILMNLFLTVEAINGLQLLLMALVSNIGLNYREEDRIRIRQGVNYG